MSEEVLIVEKSDGIATLTMNRPQAMNALSTPLRRALAAAFSEISNEDETQVVILTGAGQRAFSAGLDLKELGGEAGPAEPVGAPGTDDRDPVRVMDAFDRPIIGAINGVAVTGGFEIALACDVLIGSPEARFADTHARVGIMPGWGLSQRLSRAVGIYRAKEISLTGNFLSAEQAERWGLLNRVVPSEVLLETCRALAKDMISCQPGMVSAYKDVIDRGFAVSFGEGREVERATNRARLSDVTPERIAAARKNVQARGREQAKS